jgi:hypothetical protein
MTEARAKTILATVIEKWERKVGICFIGFCVVFPNSSTKRSVFKITPNENFFKKYLNVET